MFFSGNAFSELGYIGPPLTTNGSAQYLDHLSVNVADLTRHHRNLFWYLLKAREQQELHIGSKYIRGLSKRHVTKDYNILPGGVGTTSDVT